MTPPNLHPTTQIDLRTILFATLAWLPVIGLVAVYLGVRR